MYPTRYFLILLFSLIHFCAKLLSCMFYAESTIICFGVFFLLSRWFTLFCFVFHDAIFCSSSFFFFCVGRSLDGRCEKQKPKRKRDSEIITPTNTLLSSLSPSLVGSICQKAERMCLQYMGTIKPSERDPSLLPTVESVPVADATVTAPRHLDVHLPVRTRPENDEGIRLDVLFRGPTGA